MRGRVRARCVLLIIVCIAAASPRALGAGANIAKVADSSAGYSNFSAPSVNDAGTVAFNATSGGTAKIFTGTGGGPVTPALDPTAAGFIGLIDATSINNAGQIAFVATESAPIPQPPFQSAFRLDPGGSPPARIYDGRNGINNVTVVTTSQTPGTVFFSLASRILVMGGAGSGSGGTPDTLIPVGPTYHGVGRIAASASGNWVVRVRGAFSSNFNAIVANGVQILNTNSTYTDTDTFSFPGHPNAVTAPLANYGDADITSDGTVVFSANWNAFYDAVFSYKNGVITRVGKTTPTAIPAINDNGVVAALSANSIKFGLANLDQTLISVGDPLDGSTVTDLAFIHDGLSENGNLTFYAALADGRTGIFVTNVPEPATCAALITLLAPAALLRRRR